MIVVYLLFSFFIIFYELCRKKIFKVDALTFFNVFFFISYIAPALAWSIFPEHEIWTRYDFNYNPIEQPAVIFVLLFSYLTVFFTFEIVQHYPPRTYLLIKITKNSNTKFVLYSLFLVFLISISIISAGGLVSYFKDAIAHRHRELSYGIGTYLKYFLYPISLILIGLFAFFKSYQRKHLSFLFYIVFFSFVTFIFAVSTGGRGNLLNVFILFFLYQYMVTKKINFKLLIFLLIIFVVTVIVMSYYREITFFISKDKGSFEDFEFQSDRSIVDYLLSIFGYYQHYFYSIYESINNSSIYNFPRLGMDWIRTICAIVPGVSINDLDFFHISSAPDIINIEHFNKGPGYIPPGWIALSLMNGGLIWLFFKCVWIGFTAAILSNKNYWNISKNHVVFYFYFLIFYIWHHFLTMGAALNYGANSLGFYLLIFLLPFMVKFRLKIRKVSEHVHVT